MWQCFAYQADCNATPVSRRCAANRSAADADSHRAARTHQCRSAIAGWRQRRCGSDCAKGNVYRPGEGLQANAEWAGSGFIISPDGLAVTNNHVVVGAALIDVYVGGSSKRLSARLVAHSECADLAVIDIAGGDYPFLERYTGPVKVGLAVYALGFPPGDPEYTLTSGIISKEKAAGDSDWASVDAVLEHDARINPGNSGGPLVTKMAKWSV